MIDGRIETLKTLNPLLVDTSLDYGDKSVYVYYSKNNEDIWYVLNDQSLYYSIFTELSGLMKYLNEGDFSQRFHCLEEEDYLKYFESDNRSNLLCPHGRDEGNDCEGCVYRDEFRFNPTTMECERI